MENYKIFFKSYLLKIIKRKIYLFIFIIIGFVISNCSYIDEKIIKYSVSGTSTNARIEYKFGDKIITLENESLPWEFEYKIWANDEEKYTANLCAEKLTGDNNSIILEIDVDGCLGNFATFSGANEGKCIQVYIQLEGYSD